MPYRVRPSVVGCAIRPVITARDRSLEEIIYDISQSALADAGLTIEDIDGIVVGCNDQFDGRAISVMMASGPTGGVDRDIISTPSSSEHAFILGSLRVASGQFRTHLVVAWSPTEASSLSEAQRLGADPYFHRALPLDELSSHALQASALNHVWPNAWIFAETVAVKNRRHAAVAYPEPPAKPGPGPARWPLTERLTTRPVTGAVALVLANETFVAERRFERVAWLHGMGWATEAAFLGDRDLSAAPALAEAARQAYAAAGITDPAEAFDVVEITDATPYAELIAYDALGLSPRTKIGARMADGWFQRGGRLPVNLSGGVITFNPVFCTGLIRIAEIANQVRGRAGPHQVEGARLGLAHAGSGFAMQYQSAIVLGAEP
jgi:acetyl-CoA C-acetyltransferase